MVFSSSLLIWLKTKTNKYRNNLSILFSVFVIFVDFTRSTLSSDLLQEQTFVWEWRNCWLLSIFIIIFYVELCPLAGSDCCYINLWECFTKVFWRISNSVKPDEVRVSIILYLLNFFDVIFLKEFLQGMEYSEEFLLWKYFNQYCYFISWTKVPMKQVAAACELLIWSQLVLLPS